MSRACETDLHANSRAGILPQYFQTIESESVFVERTHSLLFFFDLPFSRQEKFETDVNVRKGGKERKERKKKGSISRAGQVNGAAPMRRELATPRPGNK